MQWRASHILVQDQLLVTKILNEIKQGADFKALAKKILHMPK